MFGIAKSLTASFSRFLYISNDFNSANIQNLKLKLFQFTSLHIICLMVETYFFSKKHGPFKEVLPGLQLVFHMVIITKVHATCYFEPF